MLQLEIEERVYNAPAGWHEVTLGKFIELCNIEIPEKLRSLWVASAGDDEAELAKAEDAIGTTETTKVFPTYYGKVMALLTTVPQEVIDRMHWPLREQFFNKHLRHYIYSSFARFPVHIVDGRLEMYDPEPKASFKLGGVEYFLPKTLKVYGEEIPLGKEQAVTFAEASDIEVALRDMAEGAANRLPMFVAIYCREKGKLYSEEETMVRAEKFMGLPMEEVWRVFFCTFRQLKKLQTFTQEYSKKVAPELVEKLEKLA
jgi:hypothetical protein